jgi:Peptidase family M1 domain/Peptidase M1 N-terminal domain
MSRKLVTLVAAVLICLSTASVALGAPPSPFPAGSSGLGDPYFPLDGNGGYDVQHYDLALTYDPATDKLTGVATITATATQNLSAFNLDFIGMRLRSLTVDGASARTQRRGQELTVKPAGGLTNGSTFTVVARYDGVPQAIEVPFHMGFLPTEDGTIVQGEPHVAATWFPANDHPRDKAAFTFHISVPAGLEAIANGVLTDQQTSGGWTTYDWNAVEPMAPYLAMIAVDDFEVNSYRADGIAYWDALDADLMAPLAPAVTPQVGVQFLWSQIADLSYKRLSRTLTVPAGGAQLSIQVNRDTEGFFDFLFVEARTAGGEDWTTLPDLNGHTSQEVGDCPFIADINPFLFHYLTPVLVDPGDPNDPDDDFYSCDPVGTSGSWNAASGLGDGWETWTVALADANGAARQVEVSITYASDPFVQGRGVILDELDVSTGEGSTGFEPDADPLDGWTTPEAPDGSGPNENTWTVADFVPEVPGIGAGALQSFDNQPEIIAWESGIFGAYPFSASGGILHDGSQVGFALENQTRPNYSPFFFGPGEGNDYVVVHELAHQWFGDYLAVDSWNETWLNEGFATYAEWMWAERVGDFTPADAWDFFASFPADDEFWAFAIGDPGIDGMFAGQVYDRGALTLHALRREVGDHRFFEIVEQWVITQGGGTVTTRELIDLAEAIYNKDLDPLFAEWLSAGKPASIVDENPGPNRATGRALGHLSSALKQAVLDKAAAKEALAGAN